MCILTLSLSNTDRQPSPYERKNACKKKRNLEFQVSDGWHVLYNLMRRILWKQWMNSYYQSFSSWICKMIGNKLYKPLLNSTVNARRLCKDHLVLWSMLCGLFLLLLWWLYQIYFDYFQDLDIPKKKKYIWNTLIQVRLMFLVFVINYQGKYIDHYFAPLIS